MAEQAIQKKTDEINLAPVFKSIQIALDDYNDIFSDFDMSPYATRVISDDFLKEMEKRYTENKKGEFEIRFTVLQKSRDARIEAVIKKRLKEYFQLKLKDMEKDITERKKNGLLRITLGLAVAVLLFVFQANETMPVATLFSVLAWYLLWSGYEYFFEVPGKLKKDRSFYSRFSKAKYHFMSEEEAMEEAEKTANEIIQMENGSQAQPKKS